MYVYMYWHSYTMIVHGPRWQLSTKESIKCKHNSACEMYQMEDSSLGQQCWVTGEHNSNRQVHCPCIHYICIQIIQCSHWKCVVVVSLRFLAYQLTVGWDTPLATPVKRNEVVWDTASKTAPNWQLKTLVTKTLPLCLELKVIYYTN